MANSLKKPKKMRVAVIGLGYVGLPLALAFGKCNEFEHSLVGFDIDSERIDQLNNGFDRNNEVTKDELSTIGGIVFTDNETKLDHIDFYIITVPTPIDEYKKPDLSTLESATRLIARHLKPGNIVVYESTVYPGCTRNDCVPILEKISGLVIDKDFSVGYSPERINPGDKTNTLDTITKVVSASNEGALTLVQEVYSLAIKANLHTAKSIEIAEAAKIIENIQRDVNIGLMNEFSMLFDRMGIDMRLVLDAANTKWNFLPFKPGLVGGHCIGVDPYYLLHKANEVNYHAELIGAGRRLNDGMASHCAEKVVKKLLSTGKKKYNTLVLGVTFKSDCSDIRNSKVVDMIRCLENYGINVSVFDPLADKTEVKQVYNIELLADLKIEDFDVIILAQNHQDFMSSVTEQLERTGSKKIVFDTTGKLPKSLVDLHI